MNKFAIAFRKARLNADKTFREIGDYIGKSIGYLSDVENGRKNPPESHVVEKIERFLGVENGSLRRIAEEVRSTLPTNINNLVRAKPQLGELLLRGDELMPDELDQLIEELLAKARQRDGDTDEARLFLDLRTVKVFGWRYREI